MVPLSVGLLIFVVSFIASQFFKLQWSRRQYPPGPTPLPIIGNLWTMRFELRHEFLIQLSKTYGNIFTVWIGQNPMVVVNGCKSIRNALLTHSEELSGRPSTPITDKLTGGKGIVFSNGHNWKQQRRFSLMTLRNLGLGKKSLEVTIQREAQHLVEFFTMTKGKVIDPAPSVSHSVTSVIAAVLFGHHFSSDDQEFHRLNEATDVMLFNAFPQLMQHLPGPIQHFFECDKYLQRFVKREIESHKENGCQEEPQDLVDFYLSKLSTDTGDANSTFDQDNLERILRDLFEAGIETTTTTLRWALLHMMTQPDIQEKVQKELDAVLGEKETVQYEDRKRLPYTNAVIHEIQRISSVQSVGVSRQLLKDTSLEGFHLKKGTVILCNLASALYDPDYWEKPHQFNPGHFLDKEGNFVTSEAFLPFSAGHRVCLGELLARTLLFIYFSSLLRTFTFRLPDGVKEVNMGTIFAITLQPHPYKTCAVPRKARPPAVGDSSE
ncbi:cytochrome P450 2J2-like isoform X2 [Lissotriton helveticus]